MQKWIAGALTSVALVGGVMAGTAFAYTDEERRALHDEIRTYLLANPEVIMESIIAMQEREEAEAEAERMAAIVALEDELNEDGYSLVTGNLEGDVTVVEFVDYRCGYCKRAHETIKDVVAEDGNIRYVVKEFPILGEASLFAAKAALASAAQYEDGDYAPFQDAMMRFRGNLDNAAVLNLAKLQDLDVEALEAAMEDPEIEASIQRTYALAQKLDINGTPAFVIGGELAPGAIPKARLNEMIADVRNQKAE